MFKRKRLTIVTMLIASIVLGGCSFDFVTPEPAEPEPVEPETPKDIPLDSATISPGVLKVVAGETLQATAITYPENATESGIIWESQNENIATIDQTGLITGIKSGTSKISVLSLNTGRLLGSKILTVTPPPEVPLVHIDINNPIGKTELAYNYKDYAAKSAYGDLDYCPTIGNPKLLVIPIWFNDSDTFIAETNREMVRQDITKAYFGKNSDTGWRSVKTFYEEESSGLVTLSGTVSKWREIDKSYKSYVNSGTSALVKDSVNWFFNLPENASLSRSDFDSDNNGYLDGVMLIYAAPDYVSLRNYNYQNLWAYCSWIMPSAEFTDPVPNVYFWASYDFLYSPGDYAYYRTGASRYGNGSTIHCSLDTHTFIHEMGHVFGLDDYYDYSGQFSPAGGFSMQDYAVGGHDPFSVMAYGWAKPYIVTDTMEIAIETFQKSRDFILLSPSWNEYNSPFDEYILLELYSPTGLNQYDCEYGDSGRGPNTTAIRMWHIDARLAAYYSNTPTITTDVNCGAAWGVVTAFTNTYYEEDGDNNGRISVLGKKYADHNILQLIRNDKNETYQPASNLTDKFLFKNGTFNLLDYSSQFVYGNEGKFNNGLSLDWTIEITLGISDNDSAAKIKLTKNS